MLNAAIRRVYEETRRAMSNTHKAAPATAATITRAPRVRLHFLDVFDIAVKRRTEMPRLDDGMHWSCGTARSAETCREG